MDRGHVVSGRVARLVRGVLERVFVLVLSTVVFVGVLEFIGQHSRLKGMLNYYVRDVDHRPRPHFNEMNGDGIWSPFEASHYRAGDRNVIFLGDSFVYGRRAGARFTVPALFESLAAAKHPDWGLQALNFGWVSASPFLECRQLEAIGSKYHPSLVVLCVDMSDIQDDVKYEKLIERKGIFALVPVIPVTLMGLRKTLSLIPYRYGPHELLFGFPARPFFASDEPLEKTVSYFRYIRRNIDAIHAYCRDVLKVPFALFILPRAYQYSARECPNNWERRQYTPLGPYVSEPFRYFDQMRKQVDYPVHSLLPDFLASTEFPTCFDDDPHWNPTGNRIAATAIYRDLDADGLLK